MMMKGLIVGIGAAGNKSTINLIEKGVVDKEDVMLINSTLADIPALYKNQSIVIDANTGGGCGKERTRSKDAMLADLQSGRVPIKSRCASGEYSFVAIVSSTEGGTGSGSATMLAYYVQNVIKLPVHLIGFTGFGSDPRGLQNTMEYFEDIEKGVIMHLIRNDKFVREAGSQRKAELAANDELVNIIKVITGQCIVESTQNIDSRDLYKTVNTPGYEVTEYFELDDKIRNTKDFEQCLKRMVDDSHAMETTPSMLRLAVIINVSDSSQEYCENFSVLTEKYGNCYELYTHRQSEPGGDFIAFIASGMKMPIDEVKAIYDNYSKSSESVDKSEDEFFSAVKQMKGNPEDSMFTMGSTELNSGSEEAFFAKFAKKFGKKGDAPKAVAQEDSVKEY